MKIQCPHCQLEGNILDEKIPEGGGNITCPKCKNKFRVSRDVPKDSTIETKFNTLDFSCPKCNRIQPQSDSCISCGLVFAKFIKSQQRKTPNETPDNQIHNLSPSLKTNNTEKVSGENKQFNMILIFIIGLILSILVVAGYGWTGAYVVNIVSAPIIIISVGLLAVSSG